MIQGCHDIARSLGYKHPQSHWKKSIYNSKTPPSSITQIEMQSGFKILPTVENTNNGDQLGIHCKGNHSALLVVGYAQAGAHIIAAGTAQWKVLQTFTIANDGTDIAFGSSCRCCRRNIAIQCDQLLLCLGRKNNRVWHQTFALAFLCSAASVARS